MKLRRLAAATTALVIAGAGVLAGSAAATADDFYLTAADLTAVEGASYPAGWFRGDVSGVDGTLASGVSGLTASGGQVQLLNGTPGDVAAGLAAVGATADIVLSSGNVTFQIPLFAGPGTAGFTTLRADPASIAADAWTTSGNLTASIGADPGFEAGTIHTLAEYEDQFLDGYTILAFGFNHGPAGSSTVAALSWNGNTFTSSFPRSTITLSATTVSPEAIAATGVKVTATGFIPGEEVGFGWGFGETGDKFDTVIADANGTATATLISAFEVGSYTITAIGADSDVSVSTTLTVGTALATTGTDALVPAIGAGILLLGGAFAVIFATRRRKTVAA